MPGNTLYYGDNLDILRRYIDDESVDLVYLDPPFNSNADYNVLFAEKSTECHGALQNRPPVGASKPASVVGLRIPHSLLVSNNYWTHHQSFFMSRRKRALCPWMPAANTIVTVNRQRFPDRR